MIKYDKPFVAQSFRKNDLTFAPKITAMDTFLLEFIVSNATMEHHRAKFQKIRPLALKLLVLEPKKY